MVILKKPYNNNNNNKFIFQVIRNIKLGDKQNTRYCLSHPLCSPYNSLIGMNKCTSFGFPVLVQQLSQVANWAIFKPFSSRYHRAQIWLLKSCFIVFSVHFEPFGVFLVLYCFNPKLFAELLPSLFQSFQVG